MMNRYVVFVIMVFLFFFSGIALAGNAGKIGVVNMQKFQERSKSFQKIRSALKKKFEVLQQKLDKEKAELAEVEAEFKKQGMMLSLDAKEDKKKELGKKRRHYKYLYDEFSQEFKEAELDARKRVGKEIEKIVGEMGSKEGYLMIMERQMPGLIYFDKAFDITDKVIDAYDKAHQ